MSSEERTGFFVLGKGEAEERVASLGGKPFHARVIRREALERGVLGYSEMSGLSKELRARLDERLPLLTGRELDRSTSRDGTVKLLIAFDDGANVETVYMPSRRADRGATLCVSTQVGCPVACPFCASGMAGLKRNLRAHEIIEQFVRGRALGPLARSVVMGIGEPLLNFESLAAALEVVHDDLGLGARKVTVSTVGFPERLRRIARSKPRFQLAISLHSPDDAERARLVPAMAGVPVEDVLRAGDDWFEQTGREITYEYVLLGGMNDSPGHAERLAGRLRGRRATVNLIPYNPVDTLPAPTGLGGPKSFSRPKPEAAESFREALEAAGVVATVRWSRGVETDAACGQLRLRSAEGGARE